MAALTLSTEACSKVSLIRARYPHPLRPSSLPLLPLSSMLFGALPPPPPLHLILPSPPLLLPTRSPSSPSPLLLTNFPNANSLFLSFEHTPHWRALSSLPHPGPGGSAGAGTGVLSKHAQVQLLEAAAILSHLSPDSETGTSLPEDRGMWPRWVSGGALEGEDDVPGSVPASVSSAYGYPSSVGGGGYSVGGGGYSRQRGRGRGGPRLHDYEVPRGAEVAQRAGVVEVPNARAQSHSHYTRHGHAHSGSVGAGSVGGGGAWSVPRSVSVSASVSSEQSRSRSTPSDDEEEEDDEDQGAGRGRAGARVWRREEEFDLGLRGVKEEGEEEYDEYGDEYDDGKEKERGRRTGESLRWGGMEEMDDIDMDMD
ncbi:hypothetical protein B0H14DRAFT_3727413 [Mycena olivaceomarginata]|nr:hypothetical protein B0H14DRAFT_3727413 [Mycena olivaceomarginata]